MTPSHPPTHGPTDPDPHHNTGDEVARGSGSSRRRDGPRSGADIATALCVPTPRPAGVSTGPVAALRGERHHVRWPTCHHPGACGALIPRSWADAAPDRPGWRESDHDIIVAAEISSTSREHLVGFVTGGARCSRWLPDAIPN